MFNFKEDYNDMYYTAKEYLDRCPLEIHALDLDFLNQLDSLAMSSGITDGGANGSYSTTDIMLEIANNWSEYTPIRLEFNKTLRHELTSLGEGNRYTEGDWGDVLTVASFHIQYPIQQLYSDGEITFRSYMYKEIDEDYHYPSTEELILTIENKTDGWIDGCFHRPLRIKRN